MRSRSVEAELRREFPQGEAWGWRRHRSERSIFWDRNHKRLTGLSDRQILIALMWNNRIAARFGEKPKLKYDEKKLWARHFGDGETGRVQKRSFTVVGAGEKEQQAVRFRSLG